MASPAKNQKMENIGSVVEEDSSEWFDTLAGHDDAVEELMTSLSDKPAPSSSALQRVATQTKRQDSFVVRQKQFQQQYASIYFSRLLALSPSVTERVKAQWSDTPVCDKISTLGEMDEVAIVTGTIYKDMNLKPSILDEYTDKTCELSANGKYISDDDYLVVEDASGRANLALVGKGLPPVSHLVSGVVAALKGRPGAGGVFEVHDILYPGLPPQAPLPKLEQDRYVVLVSGLQLGHPDQNSLGLQLLVDYITGYGGNTTDHTKASAISRVIIAGNSLYEKPEAANKTYEKKSNMSMRLVEPLKELDSLLTQLCASVDVDLMPGPHDPSNYSLPQQALHTVMFPGARTYSTFHSNTNPANSTEDGFEVLGTAGQNVDNLALYSDAAQDLDYLERMLQWRNIAPTAPDTLGCYPFQNSDPFVIQRAPHLFFAANQAKFGSRLVKGDDGQAVRCVLVPSFLATSTAVFINQRTLETHTMRFGSFKQQ